MWKSPHFCSPGARNRGKGVLFQICNKVYNVDRSSRSILTRQARYGGINCKKEDCGVWLWGCITVCSGSSTSDVPPCVFIIYLINYQFFLPLLHSVIYLIINIVAFFVSPNHFYLSGFPPFFVIIINLPLFILKFILSSASFSKASPPYTLCLQCS